MTALLKKDEKKFVINRVYAKIKGLLINIIDDESRKKQLFKKLYYYFSFILTFKTRKAVSFIVRLHYK